MKMRLSVMLGRKLWSRLPFKQ